MDEDVRRVGMTGPVCKHCNISSSQCFKWRGSKEVQFQRCCNFCTHPDLPF